MVKKFLSGQFILFVVVGGINTLSGVGIAYFLSLLLNANISFILGYLIGLVISYILNTLITFKSDFDWQKFIRFCISYVPNFFIQNIIVFITFNIMGIDKLISFILAAVIGLPITFVLMKKITFKDEN